METINQTSGQSPLTQEFRKKRNFYLVVPLLVIPFLTMAFWALGGGSGKKNHVLIPGIKGINVALPSAKLKDQQATSKLDLYQTAAKDSAKIKSGLSEDFVKKMGFNPATVNSRPDSAAKRTAVSPSRNPADIQSDRITAKLAEINRQINKPAESEQEPEDNRSVRRLNRMMRSMGNQQEKDPEMEQLDKMLTKIQNIQNPGAAAAKPATRHAHDTAFKAIPAMVDGRQKVMNGSTVRLKLNDSVRLRGQLLPKGQLLFGACQVTDQRLLLTIQNIRLDKQIIPVNLTVFSLDGMPGIPAPEAELGGAAGNGADNAIQSMQLLSMDASLGAQAAAGGINAAKGLFSKKIHKIKVKLKNEFPVLLKVNKN